jgi:ribosomal protein S27AE
MREILMHNTKISKANYSSSPNKTYGVSSFEELDDIEFNDKSFNSKMKVNCICPKCGQHHVMAFHWIGRGTPRKYCQPCKGGPVG